MQLLLTLLLTPFLSASLQAANGNAAPVSAPSVPVPSAAHASASASATASASSSADVKSYADVKASAATNGEQAVVVVPPEIVHAIAHPSSESSTIIMSWVMLNPDAHKNAVTRHGDMSVPLLIEVRKDTQLLRALLGLNPDVLSILRKRSFISINRNVLSYAIGAWQGYALPGGEKLIRQLSRMMFQQGASWRGIEWQANNQIAHNNQDAINWESDENEEVRAEAPKYRSANARPTVVLNELAIIRHEIQSSEAAETILFLTFPRDLMGIINGYITDVPLTHHMPKEIQEVEESALGHTLDHQSLVLVKQYMVGGQKPKNRTQE